MLRILICLLLKKVISFPLAVKLRNNKSTRIHADFVDQAVFELLNSDFCCKSLISFCTATGKEEVNSRFAP